MPAAASGTACLEENAVVAFIHGELDADAAAQAEAHLDICERCSAVVAELARVFDDVRPGVLLRSGDPAPRDAGTTSDPEARWSTSLGSGAEGDDDALPLPRGATVGRYVVLDLVGAGAMGLVHAAYDPELDRRVALKLLRRRALDASRRARLVREAQAAARLSHPNVVVVHDVGEHAGAVFITMEFVDGTTLGEWLTAERRTEAQILEVFAAAGRGLAAAHEAGIVHRDFKPANVLVARGQPAQVKVTDFGLARPGSERERPHLTVTSPLESSRPALLQSLTQTGALVGTPAYMSPEQFEGKPANERSDQFSFCVALYEALVGKRPFAGTSFAELSTNVCAGRFEDRQAIGSLRAGLRRALERGLQPDPAARFGSMAALLAAIEPPRSRRIMPVIGAAIVAAGSAWALAEIADEPPCERGTSRIDAVWNEALLRETAAAFEASSLPYRNDALTSTRAALDGYAAWWREVYVDACEAHRRGEQSADLLDRRMACLEERRGSMRALVEVLVEADATAVERAPEAARALPSIGPCSDVAGLRESVPPPPLAIAEDVDAVRDAIAAANARAVLGRPKDALTQARDAWTRAQEIGYAPLQSRAAFVLAEIEADIDPGHPREDLYLEALSLALEGRDDRAAATIAGFMLEHQATPERAAAPEAVRWTRLAEALVARLEDPGEVEAQLLHSKCLLARERGDLDAAREIALQELELVRAHDRPGRESVAVALTMLAHIEFERGDYARTQELFEEALQRDIELHGEGHPAVALSRQNLAATMIARGLQAEALVHLRDVLRTREALYGPDAPQLLSVVQNIGLALSATGETDAAIASTERALAIATSAYGDGDPVTAGVRDQVGSAYYFAGRFDDARRMFEQSVAEFAARVPANDRRLAMARYNLAEAMLEQGQIEDATRVAELAHESLAAGVDEAHPLLGYMHTLLGRIALARGDEAAAVRSLEHALAVREKAQATAIERAATELFLGLALRSSDATRSASLLERARAVIETDRSPEAKQLRTHLQNGIR